MPAAESLASAARAALVDALAGEHRLQRQALREKQQVDRWIQRAEFATARGLAELAAAARGRAARHTRMAALLLQRSQEMRAEVQQLRDVLATTGGGGARPPPGPSLDSRFADLELEIELERVRSARRGNAALPSTD